MARKKGIRFIFNAAIFIILEIAALAMLRNSGVMQRLWISRGFHAVSASVWGSVQDLGYYFSLKQKNDELAQENFKLTQQIRRYRLITGEDFSDTVRTTADTTGEYRYLPAVIVRMSNNSQHNYMIISKGYEDGVVEKSGIITSKGAVGIIDAVSRHYSYALSFRNSGISISARIGKEGAVGPMKWDGRSSRGAILSEIPHHIGISPGDTVYTSGYSTIFPPDIPLGTIGESRLVNGATYEIKVTLFEDFSRLRYVTIVNHTAKEELKELEEER